MKIAVFGTGYVGLVTGTCFAELGNTVTCVDIDEHKIVSLQNGKVPIFEPGLTELVTKNSQEKRLFFTTDGIEAIHKNDIIFIAVGTPSAADGSTDSSAVLAVAHLIGQQINGKKMIVNKSTVPIGTAEIVRDIIATEQKKRGEQHQYTIVSNPEFLREGSAINDFFAPDRIIVGVTDKESRNLMAELYKPAERPDRPVMFTTIPNAELIKYAANAMLAARISFMNELSHFCELIGADIQEIARGVGLDARIGPHFLQAGCGYGGSCLPKDVQALAFAMRKAGCSATMIEAIESVNTAQKQSLVEKATAMLGGTLKRKKVAVWGLAFKQKTDDMREAPSIVLIHALVEAGAEITAFDPAARHIAEKVLPKIHYAAQPLEAVDGADLLVIMTEWHEFRSIDLKEVKKRMKNPHILDGRNIYEPAEMRALGFTYQGIGR